MSTAAKTAWPGPLSGDCHLVRPWDEDAKPRPLVVFFGAKDLDAGQFNFPSLNHKLSAHRILLNNGGNQWYQLGIHGFGADFEACVAQLRQWQAALGASEICMVGTSMGGYGALRYAARLGARALVFSVDYRIGAALTRSKKYYDGPMPPPCPELRPVLDEAASGFSATLIVGEQAVGDLYSASRLQASGKVRALSVIGTGHWVPAYLSRRNQLDGLLRGFVERGKVPLLENTGRALEVSGYVGRVYAAELACERGQWDEAETLAREALARYPDGEAAGLLLGRVLVERKQFAEAVVVLSQALLLTSEDVPGLAHLAIALRETGQFNRALGIHQNILAREPGRHASHYASALLLQKLGRLAEARQALLRALRGAPGHATYKARLATVQALIKQQAAARQAYTSSQAAT